MANKNPSQKFIKGDPKTKEIARQGGKAHKGSYSIKAAMKRALESGVVSVDELAQSFLMQAKDGNGAYAKIAIEYLDGRVKDEIEITELTPKEIKVTFVSPQKAKP
jgi:hypothetical protein